jgi:hypothetical protein
VDAENLLHDERDGEILSLRGHRAIAGHLAVAHGNLHLARLKPRGVGRNHGLRRDGLHGERKTRGKTRDDEAAPRRLFGQKANQFFVHQCFMFLSALRSHNSIATARPLEDFDALFFESELWTARA